MKVQLYAIFDTAVGTYQKPFFSQSDGEVKRSFLDVAMDVKTPIGKHPEDYSLYRLGNFDDNNGKVLNEENECLCTALEVLSQWKNHTPEGQTGQTDLVDEIHKLSPGGTA